ncbi:MAG: CDP-alcohol phosphatidyltransferase family protein [Pseudomonadota bacterium]
MLRQIPNAITLMRIMLIVPIGALLWQDRHLAAFGLMLVGGVSDALDGFLARRFNWQSAFGAALDPLADKLLVATVFVIFTLQGHIPLWVAIIVLGRDFVIVAGAGVYKLLYEEIEIAPTFLSKANTAMQLILLLGLMASFLPLGVISEMCRAMVNPYGFYILAVLGVSSGLDYMFTWGTKAYRAGKQRKTYKHGPPGFKR